MNATHLESNRLYDLIITGQSPVKVVLANPKYSMKGDIYDYFYALGSTAHNTGEICMIRTFQIERSKYITDGVSIQPFGREINIYEGEATDEEVDIVGKLERIGLNVGVRA